MIELSTYALFCAGSLALIASPGPDFFYVSSRALAGGRSAGLASALGIGAGLLVHTALAASGLTLLLFASKWVFNVVKWIGAAYLVWMGISMLRSRGALLGGEVEELAASRVAIFRQGVLTNVLNPKVALTFAAFLPQFVQGGHGDAAWQIALLGATLCVLATTWFCVVGTCAGNLGQTLARHPRIGRAIQIASGTVLCGLGARLAMR